MTFDTETWGKPDDVARQSPHAIGPEKSVLSTLLQEPQEFIPSAIEYGLTSRYFYLPAHSTLFDFLLSSFSAGREIELVTLIQALIDKGLLDRVGGASAISDLYTYSPFPGNFARHVAELRTKFIAREILRIGNESSSLVYDSPDEIPETLDHLEREIMAIRDMNAGDRPQTVREAVGAVIDKFQAEIRHDPKAKGIGTGYEELDRMTGGLKPCEMFVIGARPSVGKTSFMMNMVEHVCLTDGRPCLVFSAEMSTESVTKRLIFSRARFALSQLSRGHEATKGDLIRIQCASMETAESKLWIDDTSGPSISYIRAKSRRMKREHDIEFIAIDYLGLVTSSSKQSQFSREREMAEISAGIKGLAKDLRVPIILLAQLNRDVEKRAGKTGGARPRMSDLRDSGSIEQDADMIGLLSRDDYQAGDDSDATAGMACLDLVKNRNGATGAIPLTFIADLMRFESGSPHQEMTAGETRNRY